MTMGMRFCSECGKWYSTSQYILNDTGEPACPKNNHGPVIGFIINPPVSLNQFKMDHNYNEVMMRKMLSAAKKQDLIKEV